jgi:tRNA-uridine 2-sulfurtransferase
MGFCATFKIMKTKVYLMMSGGVDSSVAAYLLKSNPNYDVYGVFMKCWSLDKLREKGFEDSIYACNWEEDVIDAKMVADKLNIPFQVWDFQDEYSDKVIDYMIEEYSKGRTPNPDVMCNSVVKFGVFYDKAISEGADYVATGHYAKITNVDGVSYLAKADDEIKDQSYFLWNIKPERLNKTLLPIGVIINKEEVRKIALEQGLLTANKKDSQGLCFVGKSSLKDMLTQRLGVQVGNIVTDDLEVACNAIKINNKQKQEFADTGYVTIGNHQGAYHYTIGQRENLYLSGGPWFVSKIDIASNTVYVVHNDIKESINVLSFRIEGVNQFQQIDKNKTYNCITRYNQKPINCTIDGDVVTLETPSTIAKGQSFVCYDNDIMVLGAIIA